MFEENKLDKKGELTSSQIVIWALIITGFIVVVIFIFLIPWGATINKEVCHQSVVLRHSANIKGTTGGLISFKCQIGKICFTSGAFQECGEFEGIKGVEKIKVKTKDDIIEEIANLKYDCWDMLGRGYLDYHGAGIDISKKYCSPCYRVAFSKEVQENIVNEISYEELYRWMGSHKIPNQEKNYLQFLYGINSYDEISNLEFLEMPEVRSWSDYGASGNRQQRQLGKIDFFQEQVILTTMSKDGWGKTIWGAVIGGGTVVALFASGGTIAPVILIAGGAVGGGYISDYIAGNPIKFSPPVILPWKSEVLREFECDEIDFIP